MTDMIRTKQLQEILCIDRKTIYRMLQDGEIPAMRVGGQWRFSRQAIKAWLAETAAAPAPEVGGGAAAGEILPLDCFANVQQVFADAMEVGAVMSDLHGEVLVAPCNPCRFCTLLLASKEGRRRCQGSWARLGQINTLPQLEQCHAGLTYARGRIQVENELVAMIFAGNFVVGECELDEIARKTPELARSCEIPKSELRAAAKEIRAVTPEHALKTLRLLEKLADSLSQIGQRRLDLILRLRQVARLANV